MPISPRSAVLGPNAARSPTLKLQRIAQAALGLAGTCLAIECDEEGLAPVVTTLDDSWTGLVPLPPLDRAVVPLLDDVTPTARALGVVDTVTLQDGMRRGENSWVKGIAAAVRGAGIGALSKAVVLGTGDDACVALAALRSLGVANIALVVADRADGETEAAVARSLGMPLAMYAVEALGTVLRTADILVSALPAADAGPHAALIARSGAMVLDLAPASHGQTRLVRAVAFAGGSAIGGLEPLLQRTVCQAESLTGRRGLTVEAVRAAVPRTLAGAEA